MKHIKHLIIIFFTIFFSLNSLWGADECTSYTTIDHTFVNISPYYGSGNTKGSDGDNTAAYYYFTVPEGGSVTFTNPTGTVDFYYSESGCPTTSSTSLSAGDTITFATAGDFNMMVKAGNASGVDYTFVMTFQFSGNQTPITIDDDAESDGITPTIIYVLGNDYDLDGTLVKSSVAIASAPSHGALYIDPATGDITYTPTSFAGNDSFTYTVEDNNGATSLPATVTITYPVPIAYDRFYSLVPSGILNGNVITDIPACSDYDDNLTMNANSLPLVGTLSPTTIPSDGSFTYTATAANGSDTFTYSIVNKYGMVSNTATVNIYVNEYCANAITLLSTDSNCTTNDNNSTSGSVTADGGQYYKIVLAEDGVLDINLTNMDPQTGGTILYYDFGGGEDDLGNPILCEHIFSKGTTSQLDAGYRSKVASMALDAGTYYLGLQGKSNTNPTDYSVDVTFRSACPDGPPIYPVVLSSVGINEPGVHYNADPSILTKIVNKEFGLHASYLDSSGNVATYDGSFGTNKVVNMTVIVEHADGDTCSDPITLGQGIILHNTQDTVITPLIIDTAYKDRRTTVTAFDYGQLFTDASGLNCNNSALNSGLCLVPACFNNVDNIRSVFPPAFQPAVMLCINGDGTPGKQAPCDSEAYYGNCGGTKGFISPSKYNTDLGCAMCLADAMQGEECSEDNFAIRPNNFDTTLLPDPFKAGEAESITFFANDFTANPSNNYNEIEDDSFVVAVDISDSTKTCAQPSIKFTPSIEFANGEVTNDYALNNVGDFNMTIGEISGSEFALVDADDTSDADRYITPFVQQIKVVPHHFGITGGLENGSDDLTFTYLSNFKQFPFDVDRNISASFDVNLSAETLANTATSNYTDDCYAKDGNLKLTLADAIDPNNPEPNSLTKLLWYHYDDDGDTNGSIALDGVTTEHSLPFLSTHFDSEDTNGTAEFNYKINFDRNVTKVVNPFIVIVNEINATDTDNVSGVDTGGNATFVYGRTHASRQRYQGDTGTANIYFESYCFPPGCNKTLLNGFSTLKRTDDVRWYRIDNHIAPVDGDIGTVQQRDATPTDATDDLVDVIDQRNNLNPSEADLDYDENSRGYPYKTTMHNDASAWLIYNEDDPTATRNEFQVEFDNIGTWTGENETDTTTTTPEGATTNRRIMW